MLQYKAKACHGKFSGETRLIRRFQQTGTEFAMHFDGAPDYPVGKWIKGHRNLLPRRTRRARRRNLMDACFPPSWLKSFDFGHKFLEGFLGVAEEHAGLGVEEE